MTGHHLKATPSQQFSCLAVVLSSRGICVGQNLKRKRRQGKDSRRKAMEGYGIEQKEDAEKR
jgi:hypothetical protein